MGTGKHYRDIPVHSVCEALGPRRCLALPFMHVFSGCDFTSAMRGIGKRTAWNTWNDMPEMTKTFIKITEEPEKQKMDSDVMSSIQRYTVRLYNKSCNAETVNEARKVLFTHSLIPLENILPTKNALYQHVKRCVLVAGYMWKRCFVKTQNLSCPSLWGWE